VRRFTPLFADAACFARQWPGGRWSAKSSAANGRSVAAELAFLTRALKAPSLAASVERLAERARAESWSHEEFLAACLQTRSVRTRVPRR
jgi:hypothetical protein